MYGNAKMWKKSYILILKKIYWWVFLSEVCRSIKTSFFSLLIFLLKSKAVFVKGVSTMLWQQWVSGIKPKGKNQISTPLVRQVSQSGRWFSQSDISVSQIRHSVSQTNHSVRQVSQSVSLSDKSVRQVNQSVRQVSQTSRPVSQTSQLFKQVS